MPQHTPDGRIDKELRLPVSKPTCPTFAGDDLSVLAVTSANQGPEDGDLAGSVFLFQTTTTGQALTPARVPTSPEPPASPRAQTVAEPSRPERDPQSGG